MTSTQNSTLTASNFAGLDAAQILERLAPRGVAVEGVQVEQNWDDEQTVLVFADKSRIVVSGPDVEVYGGEAWAAAKGAEDGVEDVETVLAEQGRDAVIATLKPGHVGWDEGAINAGAHRLSGVSDELRDAYYEAYAKAARARAEEIAAITQILERHADAEIKEVIDGVSVYSDAGEYVADYAETLVALCADLDGTGMAGCKVDYTRCSRERAKRVFDEHKERVGELYEKACGGKLEFGDDEPTSTARPALSIRGSWYRDGDDYVVVVTGMPQDAVRIGTGSTVAEAWESLEDTPIQSAGRDSGEASALSWAHGAGWCSDELEPADDEAAQDVDAPVGEVDWSDDNYAYVACLYGADGSEPGDCYVRVGEDELGLWWVDDGDDDVREREGGPYNTEKEARAAAEALAEEKHEGEEGEDAEEMLERTLTERAGEPDSDGEWCVYWETVGDDAHVVDRYSSRKAAEAAAELAQRELKKSHPGSLLCGYGVRALDDGKWVEVDDDR